MTVIADPTLFFPRPCRKHRRGLLAFLGWLFTIAWSGGNILWKDGHISWECPDCARSSGYILLAASYSYETRSGSTVLNCFTEGCRCDRSCVRVSGSGSATACGTNSIIVPMKGHYQGYINHGEIRPSAPFPCPDATPGGCGGDLVLENFYTDTPVTITIQSQTVGTTLQYRAYVSTDVYSAWQNVVTGWTTMTFGLTYHGGSPSQDASGTVTITKSAGCNCPTACGRCGFASGAHQGDYLVSISGTGDDDGTGYLNIEGCTWSGEKGTLSCTGQSWSFVSASGHQWLANQGTGVTCCPPESGWTPVAPNTGSFSLSG